MTFREDQLKKFQGLAEPKWKRAPLPEDVLKRDIHLSAFTIRNEGSAANVAPLDLSQETGEQVADLNNIFSNHLGDVFVSHTTALSRNGFHIVSSPKSDTHTPIYIGYTLEDNMVMAEHNLIHAKQGHKLAVVLRYDSRGPAPTRHHGVTHVIAEAGSSLDIVRFQNLNKSSDFFDNIQFQIAEGAQVRFFDYQVGSTFKAIGCQSDLRGRHSRFEVYNGYLGFDDDLLDLSYMAKHYGAHSESKILGKGALGGRAKKTFRGTLDFKSGSKTAVGQEEEFVLLLSKDVNADSIPALMCEEDDVIGEHAASVGRMDTDLLFYMMSRGYSEEEARRTLVTAAIADTLESLELTDIKSEILDAFEKRLAENKSVMVPVRS